MLKLLAQLLIVSALSPCLTPVIESHFTCRIKADSVEVDSQVYAHYVRYRAIRYVWYLQRYGNVQIPLPMARQKGLC